jgi:hypothetical protein
MNGPKGKEYQNVYDKFIVRGAPRELNLPSATQANIKSYMDADGELKGENPAGAQWGKAVSAIESMVLRDSMGRYISAGIKKVDQKFGPKVRDKAIAEKEIQIRKKYLPGMV